MILRLDRNEIDRIIRDHILNTYKFQTKEDVEFIVTDDMYAESVEIEVDEKTP